MEHPVVTRRLMSMNESVASTCCYREVVTPSNHYQEVLHGGEIVSGPKTVLEWSAPVSKAWAQIPGDIDFSGYQGASPVPVYHRGKNGWWVLLMGQRGITGALSLEGFAAANNLPETNPGCLHDTNTCVYLQEVAAIVHDHEGSAQAHDTAPLSFEKAHPALQYSS